MSIPPVDRTTTTTTAWRVQSADLYSTGASGAVAVRPVQPVNAVEAVDKVGEGVVIRTASDTATDAQAGLYTPNGLKHAAGLQSGLGDDGAGGIDGAAGILGPAAARVGAAGAAGAAGGANASAGGSSADGTPAGVTDVGGRAPAKAGQAAEQQPTDPDSADSDWTVQREQKEAARAEARAAAEKEAAREPISKQLLEFLQSVWRASAGAIEVAQENSRVAGQERAAQTPRTESPIYSDPTVKKSS
ncbi:hypothetical protein [Xylophilus sp.]|uniref:hypothetical protein n=1 Tax=Xylophilus sp. TaxID=2653893 RepID=UPI0013BA8FC2|nr:hypothetical protein [Xylophilus sp.]KAF1049003.1 MAG: hypothetical protein GAK38_01118 [Xylophilus sp.]